MFKLKIYIYVDLVYILALPFRVDAKVKIEFQRLAVLLPAHLRFWVASWRLAFEYDRITHDALNGLRHDSKFLL